MDLENPNRPQTALKLDEKQKQTVRALRRQISSHSTRSTEIDGDHFAKLSEEEIILLRKIVETFTSNQRDAELTGDEVDGKGRKVDRNWSIESYLSGSSNRGSGTFVNPGRFYVRVTQENVKAVEQVCIEIDNEESKNKPTTNGYGNLSGRHSFDNKIESKYKCYYGYSVAVTKQSHEAIVVRNSYVTGALPEGVTNGTKLSFTDRPSWNKASGLKHLPPRERFKLAVHLVMDNLKMRPRKMDKDFSELWRKRGNATWLGIFFTVVAIGAFFADIATDLKVAADHFRAGSNWWGSFTVMFVLLPSIIINLVSFFWYKEDEKIGRRPKSGWKVVRLTHFLLVGPIERYWRILVKSYRIKRKKEERVVDHKILIAMNLDSGMLQMILAFTEDAPQLVLQLYVLVSRKILNAFEATSVRDLWTILSICFSFVSYSRAVVNYISCLRDSKRHKGQLRWYGYLSMWLWRAFMIISRILTLVFFATEFKQWFFIALSIHFVIVLGFLIRQELYFFPGSKWKQHFFRALMSYIHLFCFFCLEGVRTIPWAKKYYILTFVENLIFSVLWYTNGTRHLPPQVELAGFICIYVFFSVGLFMMTVYYKFLHPRFNQPRFSLAAPLESELADKDPKHGPIKNQEQRFELWI